MKTIILISILCIQAFADIMIVGSSNCQINSLSRVELKNLYLGLNKTSNKDKINVLNRDDTKLYEEFVTTELKKSVVSLETYWVRMLFSGNAKPPKQISYKEWLEINNQNKCFIIYIKQTEYKDNFKRISIEE